MDKSQELCNASWPLVYEPIVVLLEAYVPGPCAHAPHVHAHAHAPHIHVISDGNRAMTKPALKAVSLSIHGQRFYCFLQSRLHLSW